VGVRTLSKERWEALQIENVEYPDILIRRIAMSSARSDNAPVAPDGKSMAMGNQTQLRRANLPASHSHSSA